MCIRDRKKYNCDFSNLTCHLKEEHWKDLKSKINQVKVIYILRDPLKRLWSHVKFHHEFIGQRPEFSDWSRSQFEDFINKDFIISNGSYSKNIKQLRKCLNQNEFKIFFFEDLVKNSKESLFELEEFLGIEHILSLIHI